MFGQYLNSPRIIKRLGKVLIRAFVGHTYHIVGNLMWKTPPDNLKVDSLNEPDLHTWGVHLIVALGFC